MDTPRLLFLIFTLITPSGCSEPDELPCVESDTEPFLLIEGEAFYIKPYDLTENYYPDEEFTWYKNDSQISNDESKNVHYHGGALFILNLSAEDSGFYHARRNYSSGSCSNHYVEIEVVDEIDQTLYLDEVNSHGSQRIHCPDNVKNTCDTFKGNLSWEKDFKLLQGQNDDPFWIENTVKEDEGIYTCICTWEHNRQMYKSSGSRMLKLETPSHHRTPEIISPAEKERFADEGYGITLNCTVFCGTDVKNDCHARWEPVNGPAFKGRHGYHVNTSVVNEEINNTYSTAVLTIERVSAIDFQTELKCIGQGFYDPKIVKQFKLKRRESIIPLVIRGVCVLLFLVFTTVLIKCFAIDLTLFFRKYFPLRSQTKDASMYDAYVVYQMQSMDKATEDTLCQFITNYLPSVLEEKCGYQLFIHGRDDIPGEDRLELVEDRMKQSRRLMVILTPGSGSGSDITDQHPVSPQISMIEGFDWQLGLHHALVQREMSVILIQLGDTGPEGYTHLPPGLQHLIRKSAPIRWPEGSRGAAASNSRFWKRVRFLMPATPAKKCSQSAII
ncbi:interleukin-1 receptor type 1 [Pagrus major]|uniref:interleukin-1 receptor type 1 n=1 Tax=Pagrus major TaxID=143350 RepID=UPI003CC84795